MAGVSGRYGKVMRVISVSPFSVPLVECTKWTMDRDLEDHTYASCATNGKKIHVPGTEDITGTLEGILDPSEGPDDPASTAFLEIGTGLPVTLFLYLDATVYHEIDAIVFKFSTEVDVESGDVIRWTAQWKSNDTSLNMYAD